MRAELVCVVALRALILDAPGAKDLVATIAAATRDKAELASLKDVVTGLDLAETPSFSSAFAFAEGRREDARAALVRGIAVGDERAAHALLWLAVEARDLEALRLLATSRPKLSTADLVGDRRRSSARRRESLRLPSTRSMA